MVDTFLLLGSNMGDRLKNVLKAIEYINREVGKILSKSSIYETEPWGFTSPLFFYNMVVKLSTNLSAGEILENILSIEKSLKRERYLAIKYESRTIDIDILFYGDQ